MPVFKVCISREITEEVSVTVEAPNRESLAQMLDSEIYSGVNDATPLESWETRECDVRAFVEEKALKGEGIKAQFIYVARGATATIETIRE